ncbi:23S rRNA (uracil(1939)-C(5))-methyltransferase RlmD [Fusibacter ferrireducens]|uniref:23S rRNA (Uracil(1939)-C(5))-methyltransferase RlmD n=1 Tax=Fusibacter ferrireducens TaxID=2785058 RepID=A0ABR9ZZ30_9FIRM|nr:23S rRNA (uracil(1939)-C(5))-methyltransferase RlmD [Fusibacter ferrireducens]MBF4695418.1 23S rRNA (uracil(1939)-C(5))-methyltransferase RlmD [Fusibacter ferrireducens]
MSKKNTKNVGSEKRFDKGDQIELYIEDITEDGDGIGKINGYTVFVHNALPGDHLVTTLIKVKKNYAIGIIHQMHEKSPMRVKAPCPYAAKCGGCQLQDLSYEGQVEYKANHIKSSLMRIGKLEESEIKWDGFKAMTEPLYYRNKGIYQLAMGKKGEIEMGFYRKRSHDLVDVAYCLLQSKVANALMKKVREALRLSGISFYDELTKKGALRRIMIRTTTPNQGESVEAMLVIVTTAVSSKLMRFVKDLEVLDSKIKSVYININDDLGNTNMSDQFDHISGKVYLTDYIGDVAFKISPQSFFQVNSVQTEVLYDEVVTNVQAIVDEIRASSEDQVEEKDGNKGLTVNGGKGITVMDLYCGIGSIGAYVAKKMPSISKIIGVEVIEGAIEDAKANAILNGLSNTEYVVGLAEEVIADLAEKHELPDIVILDPPRKGCDSSLIDTLIAMKAPHIVYVSCKPSTLARDLELLVAGGYEVKRTVGVDMFPMSTHVETIILMANSCSKAKK